MFAHTTACAIVGTFAEPVRVEVDVETGLPRITIIGLSEGDSKTARERVRCGLEAIGLTLPLARVTVSLAPADMPKHGAGFDLAIAMAVAAASVVVKPESIAGVAFHAEVGLDGSLRPSRGGIAAAHACATRGAGVLVLARGATLPPRASSVGIRIVRFDHLKQVIQWVRSGMPSVPDSKADEQVPHHGSNQVGVGHRLSDIRGNELAVRAATIAAAGGHNMLLSGPPGCGKTMLCSALAELLPALDELAELEVATIHDAAGVPLPVMTRPPVRSPHHGITSVGLVGGGTGAPSIGEITLAHRGLLFLDELAEFRPSAIDAMREPLEQGCVRLRRARWHVQVPARVQLVAAMNLCRCGRWGNKRGAKCSCSEPERVRYWNRVSGALRSRFDLHVLLTPPEDGVFAGSRPDVGDITMGIARARAVQAERWGSGVTNSRATRINDMRLALNDEARDMVSKIAFARGLSGRAQLALVRVARTIADLDSESIVGRMHVRAASHFTPMEADDGAD